MVVTVRMWRLDFSLLELVLPFHHVDPWHQTPVSRLDGGHLYLPSRLPTLNMGVFEKKMEDEGEQH